MLRFLKVLTVVTMFVLGGHIAHAGQYELGREALPKEVAAWDIDVRPDGTGLPVGSGSVIDGEEIFLDQCAACHGDFAEGLDRWPVLAGGHGTLASENPVKTVGSYWPYLSTAYDYIYRAMPFGNAQSLSPDDVYAVLAYILNMNELADDEFVLSNKNFLDIRLPNEANFFADVRPDTPSISEVAPCMVNCKESVEITMHARVIDVTPDDEPGAGTE